MGLTLAISLLALPCTGWAGEHASTANLVNPHRLQLPQAQDYRLRISPSQDGSLPYDAVTRKIAAQHGLDPDLLQAVIAQESAHKADAKSAAGAIGLMQLMPDTARRFGVRDPYSAQQNLQGGAAYLRYLLNRYQQNIDLALAAYNAGEGAVDKHGARIPPYRETQHYVPAVTQRYRQLQEKHNPYRLRRSALTE